METKQNTKSVTIYDPIHNYMTFSPLIMQIVDTPEFQRLRNIKQLGLCYFVFPGASHNRFEHSLGVSYLSGRMATHLKNTHPELEITPRQIELIRIAGLVHDLGHGFYSHFFDDVLVTKLLHLDDHPYATHERRSIWILRHIIQKYNIAITEDELIFIAELIKPPKEKVQHYLFQIVANSLTGIDCDKFDYLCRDTQQLGFKDYIDFSRLIDEVRVVNGVLAYPEEVASDILELFEKRYKLHKRVYQHPTVKSIEFLMLNIFNTAIENGFDFIKYFNNPELFCDLTDHIVSTLKMTIPACKTLIDQLHRRQHAVMIVEIDITHTSKEDVAKLCQTWSAENLHFDICHLSWTNHDDNPLSRINYYNNSQTATYTKKSEEMRWISPTKFYQILLRVFKFENS
jgi:HD superfamily phosphohydrolase